VLIFAFPFAKADRVVVALLNAAHLGLVTWERLRRAPLHGPAGGESSVTAAVIDPWPQRWVRVATGEAVAAFIRVHILMLVRSQ